MIVEHRTYTFRPGTVDGWLKKWWLRLFGQSDGSFKVYSGCGSSRRNPLESIFLLLLLRLWARGLPERPPRVRWRQAGYPRGH